MKLYVSIDVVSPIKKTLHNPVPLRRLFPSHAVADLQVSRGLRRTQQSFKGRDQGYRSDILPRLEDMSEMSFRRKIHMFFLKQVLKQSIKMLDEFCYSIAKSYCSKRGI